MAMLMTVPHDGHGPQDTCPTCPHEEEDFGPGLLIEVGDCVFVGSCHRCGKTLGSIRPDQSLDVLGAAWDRHANVETCRG